MIKIIWQITKRTKMSETIGENHPTENAASTSFNYWKIYAENGDCYNVCGNDTSKTHEFSELLKKKVYIITIKKKGIVGRIIAAIKKEIRPYPEKELVEIIGYSGAVPILKIGKHTIRVRIIKEVKEWTGYNYPPLKKHPMGA